MSGRPGPRYANKKSRRRRRRAVFIQSGSRRELPKRAAVGISGGVPTAGRAALDREDTFATECVKHPPRLSYCNLLEHLILGREFGLHESVCRMDNDLIDGRVIGDVPRNASLRIRVESTKKDHHCAFVVRKPGKNPSGHRCIPSALRVIVAAKRAGAGMAGHRSLEFFEAARWLGEVRNQCRFGGSELLISGELSCQ